MIQAMNKIALNVRCEGCGCQIYQEGPWAVCHPCFKRLSSVMARQQREGFGQYIRDLVLSPTRWLQLAYDGVDVEYDLPVGTKRTSC